MDLKGRMRMTENEAIKHLKLCKTSRLFVPNNDVLEVAIKALEEIQTYCDAEEQGLLLKLPCKVGDTVYRLIPTTYRHIESLMIRKFVLTDKCFCFRTEKTNINYSCADFGKTIFLTKEEAEQALKQMGE